MRLEPTEGIKVMKVTHLLAGLPLCLCAACVIEPTQRHEFEIPKTDVDIAKGLARSMGLDAVVLSECKMEADLPRNYAKMLVSFDTESQKEISQSFKEGMTSAGDALNKAMSSCSNAARDARETDREVEEFMERRRLESR
ncbi:MAG TPA: hypothetical protein VK446_13875 [Methylocystis sp.]|nr:hypothetical protein [Methylocystis sp.]